MHKRAPILSCYSIFKKMTLLPIRYFVRSKQHIQEESGTCNARGENGVKEFLHDIGESAYSDVF